MIFGKIKPTELRITQNRNGEDGKPGAMLVPNVATIELTATHLCGRDCNGNTVVVVPLSDVAFAVVEVK